MKQIKKFRKYETFTGFQADQELISEPHQTMIRELIPGIVQIELILPARIIVSTRQDRLIISAGSWILKDKNGRYQAVTSEQLEKDFETFK